MNKTEEAENYYRIHHAYPSWYVPHHYGYGWYDNGSEDANKTEEAENYYRLHGAYPSWYRMPHGYYGHGYVGSGYYGHRFYDNKGEEANQGE